MESFTDYTDAQEVLGIAFSSPIFTSPGLLGKQGWSPCSSDCHSDDGESLSIGSPFALSETYNQLSFLSSSFVSGAPGKHLSWPLPPGRNAKVQTHNYSRPRATSTTLDPSFFDGVSQWQQSASSSHGSESSPSISTPGSEVESNTFKRFFSAPNREIISMLSDDLQGIHGCLPPIMPDENFKKDAEWDDEENIKLNRLQASFSLLGLRQDPAKLMFSPPLRQEDEDADRTIHSSVTIPELGFTGDGLGLSSLTLSPESNQSALSFDEQMASAREQYAWPSPMNGLRASADEYLPLTAAVCNAEEDDAFAKVEEEAMTQEDRRMASRHIRQNVAARTQSIQVLGRDAARSPEPVEVASPTFNMDEPISWSLDDALHRNLSVRSTGASTVLSNDSPILNGLMSALSFDSLPTSQSQCSTTEAERAALVNFQQSPTLSLEFSYLADDDGLFAAQQTPAEQAQKDSTWQETQDGDETITNSISAAEESFIRSSPTMQALPSPMMDSGSLCPAEDTTLSADEMSGQQETHGLTKSMSTTSILDRPHPRGRSGTACFFTRGDGEAVRTPTQKMRRSPSAVVPLQKEASLMQPQISAPSMPSLTVNPVIPPRSISLEVHPDTESRDDLGETKVESRNGQDVPSVPSVWNPHAPIPSSILKSSRSMGCISPVGMLQVQEVCELRSTLENASRKDKRSMFSLRRNKAATASVDQLNLDSRREPQSWKRGVPSTEQLPQRRLSSRHFLPTLFTARTPSQRLQGQTGIPATESRNLALARLGMRLGFPTRSSQVEIDRVKPASLSNSQSTVSLPLPFSQSMTSLPLPRHMDLSRSESPATSIHGVASPLGKRSWQPQRSLLEEEAHDLEPLVPEGFVIVTESTSTVVEHV